MYNQWELDFNYHVLILHVFFNSEKFNKNVIIQGDRCTQFLVEELLWNTFLLRNNFLFIYLFSFCFVLTQISFMKQITSATNIWMLILKTTCTIRIIEMCNINRPFHLIIEMWHMNGPFHLIIEMCKINGLFHLIIEMCNINWPFHLIIEICNINWPFHSII